MKYPFFEGLKAPLLIAHRGGAGLYPENTLYAFTAAANTHRADMFEHDARLPPGDQVVVWHDETVDRCSNAKGPVSALTWNELSQVDAAHHFTPVDGQGFPFRGKGIVPLRFDALLSAFPRMRMNVELKCAEVLKPFVKLVKKHDALPRLCIGSEHDDVAARLFDALPDACHFFPKDALTAFIWAAREGEVPPQDDRFTVLDMPYQWQGITLFDAILAEGARRAGKWVNVWTVNDTATMRTLVSSGVGGIMTDRPDTLRELFDTRSI